MPTQEMGGQGLCGVTNAIRWSWDFSSYSSLTISFCARFHKGILNNTFFANAYHDRG